MKTAKYPMCKLLKHLAVAFFSISTLSTAEQPNIVIFLADDLGFGDLGCYGNPIIKTPNIDALASEGVRLTDCHSGGTVCSPSRASLLTGRAPFRSGFYYLAGPEGCHLKKEEITLATLLRDEGYDTCFVGKWHLGSFENDPNPGDHGFDHWFATEINAFDGPEDPGKFVRNGEKVDKTGAWYCDAIVDEAIAWMKNRPDPAKPFLIVVSSHEPHTPIHPPEKFSAMYEDEMVEKLESVVAYGGVHRPLDRSISENKKYYYGTVTQLDAAFGKLMGALDTQGKRDDSLVIFTSDNGPETPVTIEESGGNWEDPIRDRCFGTPGPWKGMKRYVLEGGHRVPGIVRWPGKVPARSLSTRFVNGTDWLPTVCAATGISVPTDRTIDGIDATPALLGKTSERKIPACWIFPISEDSSKLPGMAMRDGDHVIVGWFTSEFSGRGYSKWVKAAELNRFALYDLSTDRFQETDLTTLRPGQFESSKEKMLSLWSNIRAEAPDWSK
ncbi:MAG: sulfatase-like hydrolase/transferase [Akkermansiaceae bacterium]|nr:sulfatase-like hydrolase/transferase [Akkermansiaceae bacterium]